MRRISRFVSACTAVAMLSSCAMFTGSEKNNLVKGGTYYTKVNMWFARNGEIPSTNYHIGEILPAGTEVTIIKCLGTKIRFKSESGNTYELVHVKRHSNVSIEELFDRHFGKSDVTSAIGIYSDFSEREQAAVDEGSIAIGMSKDAVLMAYGYPPSHRTPDLRGDTWTYWVGRQIAVLHFDDDVVSSIDGVESMRAVKLYVVSDPPGAVIEVDGKFAGKAPCIVDTEIRPRDTATSRLIRATPARLDAPRLGVLCDAPMSSESLAGDPITVREVIPLSSGHKLGLVPGDKILSVNGKQIRNEFECMETIRKTGFGKPLRMEIKRGGRDMSLLGRTDLQEAGNFYPREKEFALSSLADMDGKVVFFDLRTRSGVTGAPAVTPPAAVATADIHADDTPPVAAGGDRTLGDLPLVASGFVVTKQGHVMTCGSALQGAGEIVIRTAAGQKHAASVVHLDQVNDWCLLRAPTLRAAPLPMAAEAGVQADIRVFRLGYPVGNSQSSGLDVSSGRVASAKGFGGDPRHVQVKIPGEAKNLSGAPVVNSRGEWIGVVSDRLDKIIHAFAGVSAEDVSFLLRARTISGLLPAGVSLVPGPAVPGPELDAAGARSQLSAAIVAVHAK